MTYLCPTEYSFGIKNEGLKPMEPITEKKRAIFDSMLELVKDHGFHGCPMSSLAKSAGVAAGTIYHYFDSKEQLIKELYVFSSARRIQAMFEGDGEDQPYKERFFRFWNNLFSFYCANPNELYFFEQFVHSPYNTWRFEEGHDHFHERLFSFVEEGVRQGLFRGVNPEILGVLVHSNIRTAARIKGFGKIETGEQEFSQIRQVLWDGLSVCS